MLHLQEINYHYHMVILNFRGERSDFLFAITVLKYLKYCLGGLFLDVRN